MLLDIWLAVSGDDIVGFDWFCVDFFTSVFDFMTVFTPSYSGCLLVPFFKRSNIDKMTDMAYMTNMSK